MASKKKGIIAIKKNGMLKVGYTHRNAEPAVIGKRLVKWIKEAGIDKISAYYDRVQLVDEDALMPLEAIESYKKYIPDELKSKLIHGMSKWSEALLFTKDAVAPLRDFYPYMVDYASFAGGLACRWRYVIDLDRGVFSVIRGGYEVILWNDNDEHSPNVDWMKRVAPVKVGEFKLESIPEDWTEECKDNWSNRMIIALPFMDNKEANHTENILINKFDPADNIYHKWEEVKFLYGENGYDKLMSDME